MNKLRTTFILLAITLLSGSLVGVQAAGESMYLSASKSTVYKDQTVDISVRMNSGTTNVNAVQANLSYPSSSLQFVSISPASTFEIQAENSGGSGSVAIGRGTLSPKSGDKLIATVKFKALKSSGSATISYTAGSQLVDNGTTIPTTQSGTSVTLASEPVDDSPSPSPSPSTPNPSTNTEPDEDEPEEKDTKAPVIEGAQVVYEETAVVKWSTNESSDSKVDYGPTEALGFSKASSKRVKNHSLKLDKDLLAAKTTYYYQITSKDKEGNKAKSDILSFVTPGIDYTVKITDQNSAPIVGATVYFLGESYQSDENGEVHLSAGEGLQTIAIEYQGVTRVLEASVSEDSKLSEDVFYEVQMPAAGSSSGGFSSWGFMIGLALGAGLLFGGNNLAGLLRKRNMANLIKNKTDSKTTLSDIENLMKDKKNETASKNPKS
ncbi:MAG: cohesin domain-containing protein [Candidatus Saccharimonadales bacterium]|nr:cohesin domain-containing protein [Candidatus Saccharimonadales bacterium]